MTLEELDQKWKERDAWYAAHPAAKFFNDIWSFLRYRLPTILNDAYHEVRYAWQRVFTGHDDVMKFAFCHQNAAQTVAVLKWMRSHKHGFPIILLDDNEEYDWESSKDDEKYYKRWNDILDKMIAGFEALIAEDEVFIVDANGKYDHAASEIERKRLLAIWEEGAALFIKYYRNLWD